MKILFLGDYDSSDIVPAPIKVAKEIFINISKTGYPVEYYCYFQDGSIYSRFQKLFGRQEESISILRLGIVPLIYQVIRFHPDIVHLLTPNMFYFVLLPLKLIMKFKVIYSSHSIISIIIKRYRKNDYPFRFRMSMIERIALKCSDKVLVFPQKELRYYRLYYHMDNKKLNVIRNGVSDLSIVKRYTEEIGILRIITVGSIEREEKALPFLIESLGFLKFKVELTICNYKEQPEYNGKQYQNLTLNFMKPMNEEKLRREIIKNDLFILPSQYDSFPLSLLEAMNTGIIILVSNRVGITEILPPYLSELIFPVNNREILIKKINFVLNLSLEQKQILSNKIREFSQSLSWTNITNKYLEIYSELIK